ncbi:aldo/keto reductase [candidate division KSB1 bacterium]|nr:aldo/keto reductase [candidate division KSB1 bacterium]
MEYLRLGNTNMQVSPVALGCWAIVGDATWGPQDESEAIETIHTALELGVNFFDTAEGYGNGYSEELLARGIEGHRQEVIIASKVGSGHLAARDVMSACERSLKRLRADTIDLYQIHWPGGRRVPFEETMGALEKLQQAGKIRAIGISNFGKFDLPEILSIGRVEANQLPYNLLARAIEYDINPICIENNISILCYSPLMQGLLTGKFSSADDVPEGRARTRHFSSQRSQIRHGEDGCEEETFYAIARIRAICEAINEPMASVALSWLLHQPGITSVLAGARNPEQMRQNAYAAEVSLSAETLRALADATEKVKEKMGRNPDMWQSQSRYR